MNKYELAVAETRSVLSEWMADDRIASEFSRGVLAGEIVERLVAKGVIQSTDPDDLRDFRGDNYRQGPLEPGSSTVGGPK